MHAEHMSQVFELLVQNSLYVKLSKCKFAKASIIYLCHLISKEGVATDTEKIEVVKIMANSHFNQTVERFFGSSRLL